MVCIVKYAGNTKGTDWPKCQKTADFRDRLLPKLTSGEIRLQDAETDSK